MTPPKKLSDTDEKLLAIEDAAERGAARGVAEHRTPTSFEPPTAAELAEARRALDYKRCCDEGPACHLGKKIDELRKEFDAMMFERATESGRNQEIAKSAAKATQLQTVIIAGAFSLAGVILGLVVNRVWPAHAQAQTVQVQGAQR